MPRRASTPAVPSPSPGYVLEWSTEHLDAQLHCHVLSSAQELRAELLAREASSSQGRILVLQTGHMDHVVREALVGIARIDGGFIDAHCSGTPCPPRARSRTPRWCSWTYPEAAAGGGQVWTVSRTGIWLGGDVPVVLVGRNVIPGRRDNRVKPKRAAASAAAAAAVDAAGYGAMGYASPSSARRVAPPSFEEDVCEALASVSAVSPDDVAVEELLGELVYERWTGCLSAMRPETGSAEREQESLWCLSLWRAVAALESNLDEARHLSRRGRQLDAVCPAAWGDLIRRLEMRVQLRQPGIIRADMDRTHQGGKTDNDRSLDRIAYLGGLMLPVSAVASILAIGGDYGPEGQRFWVFWLSSFLASVLALLVIYADQLRTVEVWFEMGELGDEDWPGERSWKSRELGWGGAVKKMSGYYWWRRDPRLAFRRPGDVFVLGEDGGL